MIPYLMSMMCLTGIHQKSQCPTQTPIMSYQLSNIWNPTNPYIARAYEKGYYLTDKTPVDKTALRGKMIRIAAIIDPPYVTQIFHNNGTLDGVAKRVINVLRQALGFDYQIVTPNDGTHGIWNETTYEWSGIMRMVLDGDADFSINFMSMISERMQAINFSRPFGEERWVVMMQRPQETTDGEGLVAPFQKDVWIYLMISFVLMCPFVYLMVRLRCWACRKYPHLAEPYSMGHCIWFVYGAIMKQGSVLKPVADSSRILFATWWIFVTILSAFYTANLTAYLTLSKVPIPYNSLDKIGYRDAWIMRKHDTLQQVLYTKETRNDSSRHLVYYKEENRNPEFRKLRWRLGQTNAYGKFMQNLTEMVDEVRRKKFLLLEEQSRVEREVYKDFRAQSRKKTLLHKRCVFIMSKNPILRIPYSFVFRNATIREIFDPVLDHLTKGGLFNYWRRWDLPSKDPCSSDSDFRERQLRNGDLWTTYQLCATGYSLGFFSFLFEIVHKWMANRKLKAQLMPTHNPENLSFYKGNLTVPAGAPTFFDTEKFLKNINGRDYIVMKTADGRARLVPKTDGLQALQPVYNPPPPMSFSFMS